MAHPDLLIGPAIPLHARRDRLAKQGPLRAIGHAFGIPEIRGEVPPLDAIVGMRAVIGGECQRAAGHDGGKTVGVVAQSRKTLRPPTRAAEAKPNEPPRKSPTRDRATR